MAHPKSFTVTEGTVFRIDADLVRRSTEVSGVVPSDYVTYSNHVDWVDVTLGIASGSIRIQTFDDDGGYNKTFALHGLLASDEGDHLSVAAGSYGALDGGDGDDVLTGGKYHDVLTGGNDNDLLAGGKGDDQLDGGHEDDRLYGNDGNDQLHGGNGRDYVRGGSGNDIVFGDSGNDTVRGSSGDDELHGGSGDDLVVGGSGRDVMTGDGGSDTFRFETIADFAGVTTATADRITDFVSAGDAGGGSHDRIDLAALATELPGGQSLHFVGPAAFSGSAGEVRAYASGGDTLLAIDFTGDATADAVLRLDGDHILSTGDLVLA